MNSTRHPELHRHTQVLPRKTAWLCIALGAALASVIQAI